MKVLVTGGAGAIGSHLVERLLDDGHDVDVVDDLSTGRLANLADARRRTGGRFSVHTLDVCSPDFAVLAARRRPAVIVHLAARPPGRLVDEVTTATASLVSVLELAAAHQVGKVVTLISAHVYGQLAGRDVPVRERHPMAPTTPAGLVGQAALAWLAHYRDLHQVEYTALVVPCVYGPRCDRGLLADLVTAARTGQVDVHGDGRQVRDLVHVHDVVDAAARAVAKGSGLPVNVGTGTGTQVRQLARLVAEQFGATVSDGHRRAVGDPERLVLDPGRARIHLGWAPFTDLAQGLADLAGAEGVPPVDGDGTDPK